MAFGMPAWAQIRAGRSLGKPILPREHGAWPVLYGSFLAGIGVAGAVGLPALLLLLGITALALAAGPLMILSRGPAGAATNKRRQAVAWMLVDAALAAAALLPLLLVFRMRFLLPFGVAAAFVLLLVGTFWIARLTA